MGFIAIGPKHFPTEVDDDDSKDDREDGEHHADDQDSQGTCTDFRCRSTTAFANTNNHVEIISNMKTILREIANMQVLSIAQMEQAPANNLYMTQVTTTIG